MLYEKNVSTLLKVYKIFWFTDLFFYECVVFSSSSIKASFQDSFHACNSRPSRRFKLPYANELDVWCSSFRLDESKRPSLIYAYSQILVWLWLSSAFLLHCLILCSNINNCCAVNALCCCCIGFPCAKFKLKSIPPRTWVWFEASLPTSHSASHVSDFLLCRPNAPAPTRCCWRSTGARCRCCGGKRCVSNPILCSSSIIRRANCAAEEVSTVRRHWACEKGTRKATAALWKVCLVFPAEWQLNLQTIPGLKCTDLYAMFYCAFNLFSADAVDFFHGKVGVASSQGRILHDLDTSLQSHPQALCIFV